MKLDKTMIIVGSAILSFFALPATASATGWVSETLGAETTNPNQQLYATTSESSAIAFTCVGTKLRATISTEGNDADNILKTYLESHRRISRNVKLSVNNEEVSSELWRMSPRDQIFVSPDRSTTIKLYNAAIRGETASIQRNGKTKHALSFPAPNIDFINFGANCGVGRLKDS